MTDPIRIEGGHATLNPAAVEHFEVAEIAPEVLGQRKGAAKYLGLIPELCIVCGACVDQCPWHCLFMIDSNTVEGEGSASLVDDAIQTDNAHVIFWVDDLECTRCNVCVERCPTSALTMEKLVVPGKPTRRRRL